MLKCVLKYCPKSPTAKCNGVAALICLMAIGILLLNFEGPAGAGSSKASQLLKTMTVVETPAAAPQAGGKGTAAEVQSAVRASKTALKLHIAQLELGLQKLNACPWYKCKFTKQESISGAPLHDPQTMNFKLRHHPFSVYMKWEEGGDVGREVLFCENEYDGKLLVKLGGLKRALPAVKLEPTSSMALAESRHPITHAGLKYLVEETLRHRRKDLALKSGVHWELHHDQKFGDRPCDLFITVRDDPKIDPLYRKSEFYVDHEMSIPVCIRNYTWPTDASVTDAKKIDEQTLIELYAYSEIELAAQLSDADFNRMNPDYKLKR